jgi:hypothetical protein
MYPIQTVRKFERRFLKHQVPAIFMNNAGIGLHRDAMTDMDTVHKVMGVDPRTYAGALLR